MRQSPQGEQSRDLAVRGNNWLWENSRAGGDMDRRKWSESDRSHIRPLGHHL